MEELTVPQSRRSLNLMLSIRKHIDDNFGSSELSGKVNYDDPLFDASELDEWMNVHFLSQDAGRKGTTMVQFTICTKIRGVNTGDRYGNTLNDLADKLHNAMHVEYIQIYDFSVSRTTPTAHS